ncbi:zinc-dependent metalloprotease [Solirubrobacter taibaiensis]|nr:zinc-dependent metalloprotease [Solirubrobacter taibaiensis]
MKGFLAASLLLACAIGAPSALAAGITSVQTPKSVKAGTTATIVVRVDAVPQCRLTAGKASATADTSSAIRVTYRFTVSKRAKPGTYLLTLRCGSETRKLRLKVIKGKGKRGTSKTLVQGKIRSRLTGRDLVLPPCCKTVPPPTPVPTATPVPTPPPVENAFRAVYALAADQTETPGYVAGIVATIGAVNGWFATQTGGATPRWLDGVKVVKLARAAADYEAADGLARLHADLEAAYPLATSTQKSVVWTQTNHPDGACASARAGVAWMTEKTCNIVPVAPTTWPFDASYVTAHEMVHLFGAVPDCAPNSDGMGHVTDDPRDLLYSGPLPRDPDLTLDFGRDDYFGTAGSTCIDIAASPLWERR